MGNKLYVGNLPFSVTDEVLSTIFSEVGQVQSAKIIIDRASGRSKGFGFVEMSSEEEAQKAISVLNGRDHEGRQMSVAEAHPQPVREGGGGGGGFGGGRGGGGRFHGGGRSGGGPRGGGRGGFGGGGRDRR